MLPGLLTGIGVDALQVYCSDKASMLVPPYASPEQQSLIRENRDWMTRDFSCSRGTGGKPCIKLRAYIPNAMSGK